MDYVMLLHSTKSVRHYSNLYISIKRVSFATTFVSVKEIHDSWQNRKLVPLKDSNKKIYLPTNYKVKIKDEIVETYDHYYKLVLYNKL